MRLLKAISVAAAVVLSVITARAEKPDSLDIPADSLAVMSLSSFDDDTDFAPALSLDALVAAPSPEAAAMTRHLEEGMDYASGTASLSVPLFSWNVGEIPMNLSLSYRIGAYKVDEEPGWFGLGWNLNGAGCVTRTIHSYPDEQKAPDIRTAKQLLDNPYGEDNVKYLQAISDEKIDAALDTYSFSCAAGSGTFYIRDGQIVQQHGSECKISYDYESKSGVNEFKLTTSDGTVYRFAEREHINYQPIKPLSPNWINTGYENAVTSWYLSEIISAENADTVRFIYDSLPEWSDSKPVGMTSAVVTSVINGLNDPENPQHSYKYDTESEIRTIFLDQKILREIDSRTATVRFTHAAVPGGSTGGTPVAIKNISVISPEGTLIRNISCDYERPFTAGRRLMTSVKVSDSQGLIDGHDFKYIAHIDDIPEIDPDLPLEPIMPPPPLIDIGDIPPTPEEDPDIVVNSQFRWAGKDFFGYPNGQQLIPGNMSIIDHIKGDLNTARKTNRNWLHLMAMEKHTTASGVATTYTYEPSTIRVFNETVRDTIEITVGSRIKAIESKDLISGRMRTREFSYESPESDIDFGILGYGDFVSVSGAIVVTLTPNELPLPTYRMTASISFLNGSRGYGRPIESATIRYGAVEEFLSGTDIATPIKTRYEYDLTPCQLPLFPSYGSYSEDDSNDNYYLSAPILQSDSFIPRPALVKAMATHLPVGGFHDRIGAEPLLKTKISYRYENGGYQPVTESRYTYILADSTGINTSVNQQSLIRDEVSIYGASKHKHNSVHQFCFTVSSASFRRYLCDSVVTETRFPDMSSRKSVTKYTYSGPFLEFILQNGTSRPSRIVQAVAPPNPFAADSISMVTGCYMLTGTRTTSAGHTMEHYTARADNLTTPFYLSVIGRGRRSLPVREIWVVDGRDTITRAYEYGTFDGVTRLTALTLTGRRGALIDRQTVGAYSRHGRPLSIAQLGQPPTHCEWGYGGDLLTSLTTGDPNGLHLTSRFTHAPLIGCTSILAPDSILTKYAYTGGRLSSVSVGGTTLQRHTYGLYGMDSKKGLNYVRTTSLLNRPQGFSPDAAQESATVKYYDGFGLPVAELSEEFSDFGDVTSITRYDALHRPVRSWGSLPIADISTALKSDSPLSEASSNLYFGDSRAYTELTYPASAEEYAASTTLPGEDFAGHPSLQRHTCSTTQMRDFRRAVIKFTFDGSTLRAPDYYYPGELDCMEATDPDGNVTLTFTDVLGRKVLVRRMTSQYSYADTYTVSDSWGNPLIVLPPEASAILACCGGEWPVTDETIDRYAFIYTYDNALRQRSVRVPGREKVEYAYDREGRLLFTRDGNQRRQGKRAFAIADALGREAVTGICNDALTDDIWTSDRSASTPPVVATRTGKVGTGFLATGYTISGMELTDASLLNATYYDDTDFIPSATAGSRIAIVDPSEPRPFDPEPVGLDNTLHHPLGRATGALTAELSDNDTQRRQLSVTTYDPYGYPSRSEVTYADGSRLTTVMENSVAGLPLRQTQTLTRPDSTTYISDVTNTYDRFGRLTSSTLKPKRGDDIQLYEAMFDQLGRPFVEFTAGFARSTMRNIRGAVSEWFTPVLSQKLFYGYYGSYPSFTGRVVAKTTMKSNGSDRRYDYQYSPLGFLTRADYSSQSNPSANYSASYTYDMQANILSASRKGISLDGGVTTGDHIYYTYEGNHLTKARLARDVTHVPLEPWIELSDDAEFEIPVNPLITLTPWAVSGQDYGYDANGNLEYDKHRKIIAINYNAIDRPRQIRFEQGDAISYIYSATGEKLSEISRSAEGLSDLRRDYYGPFEFINGNLDRTNYPQGHLDPYGYFFVNIPDYQGNIIGVYNVATGGLDQFTDYYPYGQPHPDCTAPELNRRKFGAKEFMTTFGLNEYDFDARRLSPNNLFTQPDPLAGSLTDPQSGNRLPQPYLSAISPYSYCAADPINLIDPTGKAGVKIVDRRNRTIIIKADYFVSQGTTTRRGFSTKGYTDNEIVQMNNINKGLNDANFTAPTASKYEGYSVKFDLKFEGTETKRDATIKANEAEYRGVKIGNRIIQLDKNTEDSFKPVIEGDKTKTVGGSTLANYLIKMNADIEQFASLNLIHEIMHTLGMKHLPKVGGASGIMAYPPQPVNEKDINDILNNPFLPEVFDEN